MTSADPEFDEAGTWVASSFLRATARDYARFGLLYLRDGMWDGVRLLPAGWVDYGRTMVSSTTPTDPSPYGAHWWGVRGDTLDTSSPRHLPRLGLRGPVDHDLPPARPVVVRLGKTPLEREDAPRPLAGRHGAGLRRRPLRPAAEAQSFARGDEDGDLAVGLLLVLGVGRVGRDAPLPPLRPLVTGHLAHGHGERLRARPES